MTSSLAPVAIEYAAEGMAVLPLHWPTDGGCSCRRPGCTSPAKHPLTAHGKDDASADLAQVRAWWTRWPIANIGLRPAPGDVVLDIDPRNGGDTGLAELEAANDRLPETLTARTGSGGAHLWFTAPTVTVGRLVDGVDVKTRGGYLVAPPSVHASGGRYEWAVEAPLAAAPRWLELLLDPRRPTPAPVPTVAPPAPGSRGDRAALAGVLDVVLRSQEGGRNNALHWAACRFAERVRDGRLDGLAGEAMLLDAAGRVGLAEQEARATIRSAGRAVLGG